MSAPTPKLRTTTLILGGLLVGFIAVGLSVWASQSSFDEVTRTFTFVQPALAEPLKPAGWLAIAFYVVAALVALIKRRWVVAGVYVLLIPACFFVWMMLSFGSGFTGHDGPRLTAANGQQYGVVWIGFQDHIEHLVEFGDGTIFLRARSLATTDDFGAPAVRLVRPKGALDGPLVTDNTNRWVVYARNGCATAAFDTKTKTAYGRQGTSHLIGDLSPFVLLDAACFPREADMWALREGNPPCRESVPWDDMPAARKAGAKEHSNARIREMFGAE